MNYVYQSGKYVGKDILSIVLSPDYREAKKRLEQLNSFPIKQEKNKEHQALEQAINLVSKTKPTKICPFCKLRPVTLVAIYDHKEKFAVHDKPVLCCSDQTCKNHARYTAGYYFCNPHLRKCDFSIFDARTRGYKRMINPDSAWRIIMAAFEINQSEMPTDFIKRFSYS
ncbi:MAG: hypothetical protein V1865_00305 [bacterium]